MLCNVHRRRHLQAKVVNGVPVCGKNCLHRMSCGKRNIPDGARWVVVSHAFIAGASSSKSERPLTRVGGVETVSSAVFEGAHYVALGHLHRPQSVGASHIRSGTLDQVLQVLNSIVRQNRAVGLISHVPLVQEAIPNGFYVRKGISGSSVEERGLV